MIKAKWPRSASSMCSTWKSTHWCCSSHRVDVDVNVNVSLLCSEANWVCLEELEGGLVIAADVDYSCLAAKE